MSEHFEACAGGHESASMMEAPHAGRGAREEAVITILADLLVRRPSDLTDEVQLVQDLNFDEIDCIDVALAVEDMFGIEFTGDEVTASVTVGALIAAVMSRADQAG